MAVGGERDRDCEGFTFSSQKPIADSLACPLLIFFSELTEITFGGGFSFGECALLAPLQDFGGTDSLHNPVINGGRMSAVHENVGNVVADPKAGVRRFVSLSGGSGRDHATSPLFSRKERNSGADDWLD